MGLRLLLCLLWVCMACSSGAEESPSASTPEASAPVESQPGAGFQTGARSDPVVARQAAVWTGDLEGMRKDGVIRALVVRNQTGFFLDRGRPRGFEFELLEQFEKYLNNDLKREGRRIDILYFPVRFEELLAALQNGRGDLAAAGLTVTPEREEQVAFTDPYIRDVAEVLVSNAQSVPLASLDDLAGHTVHVADGTSYVQHLENLSRQLTAQGHPAIEIVRVAPPLDTEDVLELVHAGVFELSVADEHLAELWSQALPQLRVHENLKIHESGNIAWAVRKESPALREKLNAFVREHRRGTLLGNVLFRRYFANTRWIRNPLGPDERAGLDRYDELFQKHADRYDFDWLKIAAQAYQESGFDSSATSRSGAIGLMQLLPSTAADPNVGIPDISDDDSNVHAGVRYMAFLRDRYVAGPHLKPAARFDLTLASYNLGPNRVRRLRNEAARRGLDPDRWFDNVEVVALDRVGREPVRYVANINKYFVAYSLALEDEEAARDRRNSLLGSSDAVP